MLLQDSQHGLEETLWVALRMMEERKNLLSSIASRQESPYAVYQTERIEELKKHVNRLREFLVNGSASSSDASRQEHYD